MSWKKYIARNAANTALVIGGWFIIALLTSAMTFITAFQEEYPLSTIEIITLELLCIWPWAVSTPLIIWMTRRYRLGGDLISLNLFYHCLTALFVFTFHSVVQSYEVSVYLGRGFGWSYIWVDFVRFLDMRLMLYAGIVLGVHALDFQRKGREMQLREPRLNTQLNDAKYQSLLNRIEPVFLLNTIDAIREQSRNNPDRSEQILTAFSDLLRIMLQNGTGEEVSIQKDLKSFGIYSQLLERRLGQKIIAKVHIEEACYEASIPSFLMLVPVIEEIVFESKNETDNLGSISYNAICTDKHVHSTIVLEDISITQHQLNKHLKKIHFPDIIQKLDNRYGHKVSFNIHAVPGRLHIERKIPFNSKPIPKKA